MGVECGLGFLRELREDKTVTASEELLEFGLRNRILGFERYPMSTSQVWRRNNSRTLDQFHKFFNAAFERKPVRAGFEPCNGVHLPTNLEHQIVFPLQMFGCVRKRKTELTQPVDAHGKRVARERARRKYRRHPRPHRIRTFLNADG